ncbi:MAG TPA: hypothetical protein VF222_06375 [Nitrososphaeraceae archaeon]
MTNYTIQPFSNSKKLSIFVFFATSLLLTSTYSYAAECMSDVMANKTKQNIQEKSTESIVKSKQQQEQRINNNILSPQSSQQLQKENEQKTENIRVITTLLNAADQLTGLAKVTVTFENENNEQITFQSNNKTITAEEEIVFPLTLTKPITEKEQQPSTMDVCAVTEGVENECDTVLLVENQTKPYKVNLELINFEEVEPIN